MTDSEQRSLGERASMDYWLPRLEQLEGVPTPTTATLACEVPEDEDIFPIGVPPTDAVAAAIEAVGGPPAFIRTDQTSAKHQFDDGARLNSTDTREIQQALARLRDRHGMAFTMPPPAHYYVREFLELEHEFTAFGGTPIAVELRVFIHDGEVHDGEVHDHGFYWPRDAIKRPDTNDWLRRHARTKARALEAAGKARDLAATVANEFAGYWSVDFALADDQWYCIDMAPGEISWHPESVTRLVADPRGPD